MSRAYLSRHIGMMMSDPPRARTREQRELAAANLGSKMTAIKSTIKGLASGLLFGLGIGFYLRGKSARS